MEPTVANDVNSFDPSKLKSSPIPISFISFNFVWEESQCNYCGINYSEALLFNQKYCKNCLSKYINHITDNNTYLDVHIVTKNVQCNKHEVTRNIDFCTQNIQEWCESCSDILYFKQVNSHSRYIREEELKIIQSENDWKSCKLCGKLVYNEISNGIKFRLCSDCYKISSGWIESTLLKKCVPILYLPWWDDCYNCFNCTQSLNFISDYQKWCIYCHIIYTGCRYCLTTNVILGIADQSQCRKCKRKSFVVVDTTLISSGNNNIDELIHDTSVITNIHKIAGYVKSIGKESNPLNVYEFFKEGLIPLQLIIRWIPFSRITNLE